MLPPGTTGVKREKCPWFRGLRHNPCCSHIPSRPARWPEGWLAVLLARWLAVWLAVWHVGCTARWLAARLAIRPDGWSAGRMAGHLARWQYGVLLPGNMAYCWRKYHVSTTKKRRRRAAQRGDEAGYRGPRIRSSRASVSWLRLFGSVTSSRATFWSSANQMPSSRASSCAARSVSGS